MIGSKARVVRFLEGNTLSHWLKGLRVVYAHSALVYLSLHVEKLRSHFMVGWKIGLCSSSYYQCEGTPLCLSLVNNTTFQEGVSI